MNRFEFCAGIIDTHWTGRKDGIHAGSSSGLRLGFLFPVSNKADFSYYSMGFPFFPTSREIHLMPFLDIMIQSQQFVPTKNCIPVFYQSVFTRMKFSMA